MVLLKVVWKHHQFSSLRSLALVEILIVVTIVGTPPQTLPVSDSCLKDICNYRRIEEAMCIQTVFDTGSVTLEVTSTLCNSTCFNQIQFNATASSTFVDGGVEGSITFATGGGVNPAIGDEYTLTLRNATDVVGIGNASVPNVEFFQVVEQTEAFDLDPYSGIQGEQELVWVGRQGYIDAHVTCVVG